MIARAKWRVREISRCNMIIMAESDPQQQLHHSRAARPDDSRDDAMENIFCVSSILTDLRAVQRDRDKLRLFYTRQRAICN